MGTNIRQTLRTKTIAMGTASIIALAGMVSPVAAAPLGANAIVLSEAAPSQVIEVGKKRGKWKKWSRHGHRHGHRHRGHDWDDWGKYAIAGLALGIIGSHWGHPYYYAPRRCLTAWGWVRC
jgi:hypothetical protein